MGNENKNKGNPLLIIIIILLVVLIGIGGILVYRTYNDNENTNVNEIDENNKVEEDTNAKSDVVELSSKAIEFYGYGNLYNNIYPSYYHTHDGFADLGYYYHNSDYRSVESMDSYFKMYLVARLFDNLDYDIYKNFHNDYIVPEKVFEEEYQKLFGNDKINFDVLEDNNYQTCPGIYKEDLNDEKLVDEIYIATQCGGTGLPGILTAVVKYEKNNESNELYIYEVVGYTKYQNDELFDLYSDEEKTNLIDSEIDLAPFEYNLLDLKDKLPMYKYTFKYNDNGDYIDNYEDYYFYSVEKVK